MAKEMVTKFFVEHIKRWLDEEMKRDEQLAARHEKSYKEHRGLWFGICF